MNKKLIIALSSAFGGIILVFLFLFVVLISGMAADAIYYPLPPENRIITDTFGAREPIAFRIGDSTYYTNSFHSGIDYGAPVGTPVYAAASGTVITAEEISSLGNVIIIQHDSGSCSKYYHLDSFLVKKGDYVTALSQIATVGNTGLSTGAHLHFTLIDDNGEMVDPLIYFTEWPDGEADIQTNPH